MFGKNKVVVVATKKSANSPFIPDSIENTTNDISNALNNISNAIHNVAYWFNPSNLWNELGAVINHPGTVYTVISATIIASWFIVLGSQRIKKWTGYGLLTYFILKVVFV